MLNSLSNIYRKHEELKLNMENYYCNWKIDIYKKITKKKPTTACMAWCVNILPKVWNSWKIWKTDLLLREVAS